LVVIVLRLTTARLLCTNPQLRDFRANLVTGPAASGA
jgi:hypothetical protein